MHNSLKMTALPKFSCSGENVDNTKFEEYLEENSIVQDDYKKLKQENESYQQELYVLRLKLESSCAFEKELQEANEILEQSLAQCTTKAEKALAEKDEKYRIAREEYENQIANLETNIAQNIEEIAELYKELKKYKDLTNERLHNRTCTEDNLILYKERIKELSTHLQNGEKKQNQLEEKLKYMEGQYQEFQDILKITKNELAEKNIILENTREELSMNRMELESLKMAPASDECKGNSLFAEVEDRRQMLLDKMKALQNKYNKTKQTLNAKTNEIKILKAEKAAMVRKWETDAIDTLQEDTDLLNKYKSRIFEIENKLKDVMKKSNQEELQSTEDSFNYAQLLLVIKKKEIVELNEKLEKQSMEILMREEANHDISKQLRHWRSKAMSMEAQILAMKMQLEMNEISDNDILLRATENCKITDDMDFEKAYDLKADMSDNNIRRQGSVEMPMIEGCLNGQKEIDGKTVQFAMDTKITESKSLKKQSKQCDYPIIIIPDML